jgi:hypothetical protein
MGEARRRRVLVAVTPTVLEGAFAAILELIALDEVVQFHRASAAERSARYDAAIVTADFDSEVVAGVVIGLPDTEHDIARPDGGHRAHLTIGDASGEVDIHDQREVIDLLDAHVPAGMSRRDRLVGPRAT